MTGLDDRIEQCIDALYRCLGAPDLLPLAVGQLRALLDGSAATFVRATDAGALQALVVDGLDPAAQALYERHYVQLDPAKPALMGLDVGQWCELAPDVLDPARSPHREYVNDFARRADVRWFTGAKVARTGGSHSYFSVQRPQRLSPFDARDRALLHHLTPHLGRVSRLLAESGPALGATASAAALDALDTAIFCVDAGARLVQGNRAAESLLRSGRLFSVRQGRLCGTGALTGWWPQAVRLATSVASPRACALRVPRPDAQAVQLRVIPGHEQVRFLFRLERPFALVFVQTAPVSRKAELQRLLRLTAAEAALVDLLIQGQRLEDCAARRRVSVSTVRSQLAAVFSKTGTTSQGQLVALAMQLPALRPDIAFADDLKAPPPARHHQPGA